MFTIKVGNNFVRAATSSGKIALCKEYPDAFKFRHRKTAVGIARDTHQQYPHCSISVIEDLGLTDRVCWSNMNSEPYGC